MYTSEVIMKLNTIDKVHMKCNCINGSFFNDVQKPILYSFVLDKPPDYNFFQPQTKHFKKINKSVFNTVTLHLEDEDYKKN